MSKTKPKVISQDDFEAQLQSTPQVFDAVTLGISAKKDGGFNIIQTKVDSKTLEAGEVTVIDTAENKLEAVEKFKINVVRLGVI